MGKTLTCRAGLRICLDGRQLDGRHKRLQTHPQSTAPTKQVVSIFIFYTIYTVQSPLFFFFSFFLVMVHIETVTQTQSQWPTRHLVPTWRRKHDRHESARERSLSTKHQNNNLSINIKIFNYIFHFFSYVHIVLLIHSLYVHQQVQNTRQLVTRSFFRGRGVGLTFNFRIAVVVLPAATCFMYFAQQGMVSSNVALQTWRSVSHLTWMS